MSWIVMNATEGPLIINELGINLTGRQHFDLDMIGRTNAEKSNEVKLALQKGWLRQIRKDPLADGNAPMSPAALDDLKNGVAERVSASMAAGQQNLAEELAKTRMELEEAKKRQDAMTQHQGEITKRQDLILSEIQKLAEMQPSVVETVKKAMANIKIEQTIVAQKKEELKDAADNGVSPEEIKTQEKILSLKEKKLEKNFQDIGKTLSKSAGSADDALNALDELGI